MLTLTRHPRRVRPVARFLLSALLAAAASLPAAASADDGATAIAPVPVAHTTTGKTLHWASSPVRVVLDASLGPLGDDGKEAIIAAFDAWRSSAGVPLPEFQFVASTGAPIAPTQDGISTITIGPITDPVWAASTALTHVYSNSAGAITETDMVLNSAKVFGAVTDDQAAAAGETWDTSATTTTVTTTSTGSGAAAAVVCTTNVADPGACDDHYDVQNVVTHEVGHVLGLGDDLADAKATMYFCTRRCETYKRKPSTADLAAITTSYKGVTFGAEDTVGVAAETGAAAGCAVAPSTSRSPGGSTSVDAAFASVGTMLAASAFRRSRARKTARA